jgi:large subunit ribosomal protein L13
MDADGKILGRISTEIALILTGKNKVKFSKHMDMGDYVVVINAKKVELTGNKPKDKVYRGHSGYPGGFKEVKLPKLMKENPARVIEHAVAGMLPDNRLRQSRLRRLKIFVDETHPYADKLSSEK